MLRVRVLKEGITQRVGDTEEFVAREVGEIIEVTDIAYFAHLLPEGLAELVDE